LNFEFHPRPRNEEEQAKWDAEAEERAEVEREEERAYENATIGEWEFDMDAKLNPELLAKKKRLYADNREQWFSMRAEKPLVKGQQVCCVFFSSSTLHATALTAAVAECVDNVFLRQAPKSRSFVLVRIRVAGDRGFVRLSRALRCRRVAVDRCAGPDKLV